MNVLSTLYRSSLSLLTDLYQLTMSYGYWKSGVAEREAVFHLFFRKNPFKGGFAIAAGLEYAVAFMENFKFAEDDLAYLAQLIGNDGKPLFEAGFLDFLRKMDFQCDVDAMPEGTAAFPHEPLLRIKGPLWQCQLLETPLLTVVNFQTLIATKAARICRAAAGDTVLEFGLRRAQGIDGGLAASRAAYVGGVHATSNVLAGKLFGIPVRGTHAHSWIMSFDSEMEAFQAYARAMPNNCVFLVDTYDTLEGVRKAAKIGLWLRQEGFEMAGIRLDSGDLAKLSIAARKILDDAGLPNAQIVASNDLNDHSIQALKAKGATISVWGVGTKLATSYDQPALGGVYKLAAIRGADGAWDFKVKLSEQLIKVSNPGLLQVRRMFRAGKPVGDLLYNQEQEVQMDKMMDPLKAGDSAPIPAHDSFQDLLEPIFRKGKRVRELPVLDQVRAHTLASLEALDPATLALDTPTEYPVGLEENLYNLKMKLIQEARHDG
ncbi:MAG TPA: nicotinate phosphoribosyltransferase [Bacteroidetes bacterium]|nr:nicotinate phosphoribosyltransferase [Bacteroidota bacterium]